MPHQTPFTEIVQRVETIPSPPQVITQVVRLVNDPNATAEQIEAIMSKDVGMASKVLRMVNSVYYGLDQPMHDLGQAIRILGFKTVRSVALSISAMNAFQQQNVGFSMKAYWTHCSVAACLCRMLANRAELPDPELAFTVGLFKDVGILVLAQHAPDAMRETIKVAQAQQLPFAAAARQVMGRDQATLGAKLVRHWGMEDAIVDAIQHQDSLVHTKHPRLVAVTQFSEYLCATRGLRLPGQCEEPVLDDAVWTHLGLERTALVDALAVVDKEVQAAKELLEVAYS